MNPYNQTLLADANTDNYSTIVAFEEEQDRRQQENQTKASQDGNSSLSTTDFHTADAISSAFAVGLVLLVFVTSKNTREALMRLTATLAVLPMMAMAYYFLYILPRNMETDPVASMVGTDKLDYIIHDPTFLIIVGAQIVTFIIGGILAYFFDKHYPVEK